MTVNDWISSEIAAKFKSQSEFARAAGIPLTTLRSILSRDFHGTSVQNAIQICNALGINPTALSKENFPAFVSGVCGNTAAKDIPTPAQRIGRAYMTAPPPIQRTVEVALEPYMTDDDIKKAPPDIEDAEFAEELAPITVKLRLYTQSVAAGLGNYQDDDDFEMAEFPSAPKNTNIAVRISGDSMEPKYIDGDIVFVETESVLQDGEIGIFNYDGSGYIKQLRTNPARLVSLNPNYEDIRIRDESGDIPLRTIGRVVGKAMI